MPIDYWQVDYYKSEIAKKRFVFGTQTPHVENISKGERLYIYIHKIVLQIDKRKQEGISTPSPPPLQLHVDMGQCSASSHRCKGIGAGSG